MTDQPRLHPKSIAALEAVGKPDVVVIDPQPPAGEPVNRYDKRDIVRREAVMIADGLGELKIAAYRVRDPETGEFSPIQFHMTHDNTVMALMGEEAAKLFVTFVNSALAGSR